MRGSPKSIEMHKKACYDIAVLTDSTTSYYCFYRTVAFREFEIHSHEDKERIP